MRLIIAWKWRKKHKKRISQTSIRTFKILKKKLKVLPVQQVKLYFLMTSTITKEETNTTNSSSSLPTKRKILTSRLTLEEDKHKPSSTLSNTSSITSKKKVRTTKTTWKVTTQIRTFSIIKHSKTISIMTSNNTQIRINCTTIKTIISINTMIISRINNTTTTTNNRTSNITSSSITIKAMATNSNNSNMIWVIKVTWPR